MLHSWEFSSAEKWLQSARCDGCFHKRVVLCLLSLPGSWLNGSSVLYNWKKVEKNPLFHNVNGFNCDWNIFFWVQQTKLEPCVFSFLSGVRYVSHSAFVDSLNLPKMTFQLQETQTPPETLSFISQVCWPENIRNLPIKTSICLTGRRVWVSFSSTTFQHSLMICSSVHGPFAVTGFNSEDFILQQRVPFTFTVQFISLICCAWQYGPNLCSHQSEKPNHTSITRTPLRSSPVPQVRDKNVPCVSKAYQCRPHNWAFRSHTYWTSCVSI